MPFYKILEWKSRLMKKLNDGILNIEEWERFIAAAKASNCEAIADDMRKRFRHYAVSMAGVVPRVEGQPC